MSDQQDSLGCGPTTLVTLGIVLLVLGIIVVGVTGECVSSLSHLGGSRSFWNGFGLMFVFGGPFIVVGGLMIYGGIAMRRGPPRE